MPWLLVMSRIMSAHAGGGATAGGGLGSTVAWPAGGEGGLMPVSMGRVLHVASPERLVPPRNAKDRKHPQSAQSTGWGGCGCRRR